MKKAGVRLLRTDRLWLVLVGLLFCTIVIYIADFSAVGLPQHFDVERALVLSAWETNLWEDYYIPNVYVGTQRVLLEVLTGAFAGQQVETVHFSTRFEPLYLRNGMEVLISVLPEVEALTAYVMNIYGASRGRVMLAAVGMLIVSMIIMGRKKGLFAALSLGFTLITVLYFMIAFIVQGYSPVVFSLITAVITTMYTLFMVSGISRQSIAAVAGTWVGLVFAGVLSLLFSHLGHVSGLHLEDARQMLYHAPQDAFLRIPDMFFAGVIVAASGVVVDAAMSISSSVFEIHTQSPDITAPRLYKSGMRIGGDILGANSNTLILAFVGASLPTIILIVLYGFPYLRIINLDIVAIEIIQGVSATMGMIVAIPATAFFSSWLATRKVA
ncbi:MAG: YibE/F family protein [Defluviitaleaceae bacterium]|nr:YibE/F family protein [Defluviitaleaceae bacterium]MCL2275566.1 YibE/F family protein [Defluviitaleaceae bacterium]